MAEPLGLRRRPCNSCPYRQSVAAGIWHEEEYAKLPLYDGEIHEQQTVAVFHCHQRGGGDVCAGWLGHRDPLDLMAVRIGLSMERLPPEAADYTTTVPLFASGEEAAAHGRSGIARPSDRAYAEMDKLRRQGHLDPGPD